jgi:hypothetical protein
VTTSLHAVTRSACHCETQSSESRQRVYAASHPTQQSDFRASTQLQIGTSSDYFAAYSCHTWGLACHIADSIYSGAYPVRTHHFIDYYYMGPTIRYKTMSSPWRSLRLGAHPSRIRHIYYVHRFDCVYRTTYFHADSAAPDKKTKCSSSDSQLLFTFATPEYSGVASLYH